MRYTRSLLHGLLIPIIINHFNSSLLGAVWILAYSGAWWMSQHQEGEGRNFKLKAGFSHPSIVLGIQTFGVNNPWAILRSVCSCFLMFTSLCRYTSSPCWVKESQAKEFYHNWIWKLEFPFMKLSLFFISSFASSSFLHSFHSAWSQRCFGGPMAPNRVKKSKL